MRTAKKPTRAVASTHAAIRTPVQPHYVQTERDAHGEWAQLTRKNPAASIVLHTLIANMDAPSNSIIISREFLGEITHLSKTSIQRAIKTLIEDNWIEVVKLGNTAAVAAYRIDKRAAWAQSRDKLHEYSRFTTTALANRKDQDDQLLGNGPLRKTPPVIDHNIDATDKAA